MPVATGMSSLCGRCAPLTQPRQQCRAARPVAASRRLAMRPLAQASSEQQETQREGGSRVGAPKSFDAAKNHSVHRFWPSCRSTGAHHHVRPTPVLPLFIPVHVADPPQPVTQVNVSSVSVDKEVSSDSGGWGIQRHTVTRGTWRGQYGRGSGEARAVARAAQHSCALLAPAALVSRFATCVRAVD